MLDQTELQENFEQLIADKYSQLQATTKWNQTMWHINGDLVVSLIHMANKSKFCLFNNDELDLDKLQRWNTTTYSKNLEVHDSKSIDWSLLSEMIDQTISQYTTTH